MFVGCRGGCTNDGAEIVVDDLPNFVTGRPAETMLDALGVRPIILQFARGVLKELPQQQARGDDSPRGL